MIRYTSLSSSSVYGNAYLVEGPGRTRVLVDCGTRLRRLETDLRALGVDPEAISALLITHEHADHTYGLNLRRPFALRHRIPVYAHPELLREHGRDGGVTGRRTWSRHLATAGIPVLEVSPGEEAAIGGLAVVPFGVPHDARAPLGFVFRADHTSLGIATDLGHVSAEVAANLCGCTHIVLESNHDRNLEVASGRPWSLIRRVLGNQGHLSNEQASASLPELVAGRTRSVLLAHLSLDCNTPELALDAAAATLAGAGWRGVLAAAPPDRPSGWLGR